MPASARRGGFPEESEGSHAPRHPNFEAELTAPDRAMLDHALSCTAVGTREMVGQYLRDLSARTQADELMLTAQIHDHAARLRSFEIAMAAHRDIGR